MNVLRVYICQQKDSVMQLCDCCADVQRQQVKCSLA